MLTHRAFNSTGVGLRMGKAHSRFRGTGAVTKADLQGLRDGGRVYLEQLQQQLSKTTMDKDVLEHELANVRLWLDRVDSANTELLEALKDIRAKLAVAQEETEAKRQRIRALEAQCEADADRIEALQKEVRAGSRASRPGSISVGQGGSKDFTSEIDALRKELQQVKSERDSAMASPLSGMAITPISETESSAQPSPRESEEVSRLRLELRKRDRMLRKQNRTHSQQLRDVSEAEIARDWQANQDVLAADRPDNAADRSVEAFVKAHTAVLTRASKFLENLQQTSEQLSKELERDREQWDLEQQQRQSQLDQMLDTDDPEIEQQSQVLAPKKAFDEKPKEAIKATSRPAPRDKHADSQGSIEMAVRSRHVGTYGPLSEADDRLLNEAIRVEFQKELKPVEPAPAKRRLRLI